MTTPPIPPPPPPSQNIGPFYSVLGAISLLGTIGIGALVVWKGGPITLPEAVLLGATPILSLALLRPAPFDALVRMVATKLPFTKYGDPDARS